MYIYYIIKNTYMYQYITSKFCFIVYNQSINLQIHRVVRLTLTERLLEEAPH